MTIRRAAAGIPRRFVDHPAGSRILAECDITMYGRGSMQAKLVVLKTPRDLRSFWREAIGHDLGKGCQGAVNALRVEIVQARKGHPDRTRIEVDPRYFCIIGLAASHLSMEIVCHEAAHAGFAYARRNPRVYWIDAKEMDEEAVCYPAGRIAAAINRFLFKKDLYPRGLVQARGRC